MSWKDIPLVRPDAVSAVLGEFSSSFRKCFTFLHEMPSGDAPALRRYLYQRAVTRLLSELPMSRRQMDITLKAASVAPEMTLDSITKDAARIGAKEIDEKVRVIRQTFSYSAFRRILSSRGMGRNEITPICFWIQLGKGCVPYLRVRAGFRSGTCSLSPIPRPFLKKIAEARNHHDSAFPCVESGYSKVSFDGRVYAVAAESELRFLIPLSGTDRIRYERAVGSSHLMNGTRVRYALAPMLHEIVCPLGIELPFDPYLAGGLVRDASPLDL